MIYVFVPGMRDHVPLRHQAKMEKSRLQILTASRLNSHIDA